MALGLFALVLASPRWSSSGPSPAPGPPTARWRRSMRRRPGARERPHDLGPGGRRRHDRAGQRAAPPPRRRRVRGGPDAHRHASWPTARLGRRPDPADRTTATRSTARPTRSAWWSVPAYATGRRRLRPRHHPRLAGDALPGRRGSDLARLPARRVPGHRDHPASTRPGPSVQRPAGHAAGRRAKCFSTPANTRCGSTRPTRPTPCATPVTWATPRCRSCRRPATGTLHPEHRLADVDLRAGSRLYTDQFTYTPRRPLQPRVEHRGDHAAGRSVPAC